MFIFTVVKYICFVLFDIGHHRYPLEEAQGNDECGNQGLHPDGCKTVSSAFSPTES